jgi:hypothetical protein
VGFHPGKNQRNTGKLIIGKLSEIIGKLIIGVKTAIQHNGTITGKSDLETIKI